MAVRAHFEKDYIRLLPQYFHLRKCQSGGGLGQMVTVCVHAHDSIPADLIIGSSSTDSAHLKMTNSKTSEPGHRISHLGAELARPEHERPVCLALIAHASLCPISETILTPFLALPGTFAPIATQIIQESYWLVQTL